MTRNNTDTTDANDSTDAPCTVIESNAAHFYAVEKPLSSLVDECKLHVREDGLYVTAVDPANVGMIDLHAAAGGFDNYSHGSETTFGLALPELRSALSPARKGQGVDGGDPVTLRIDPTENAPEKRLTVAVERDDARFRSGWYGIDPDSIRKEPDDVDLTYGWKATPDTLTFRDALEHINGSLDYTWVSGDGSALVIGGEDEDDGCGAAVRFDDCAWNEPPDDTDVDEPEEFKEEHADDAACYPLDYMSDMAKAVRNSRMERLQVSWGDQYPAIFGFDQPEWGISGEFMLAPRMVSDDSSAPAMAEWQESTEVDALAD